jgi:hypothetical protein
VLERTVGVVPYLSVINRWVRGPFEVDVMCVDAIENSGVANSLS